MGCDQEGGCLFVQPNTCVLVAPNTSTSTFKRTRGRRRRHCCAAAAAAAAAGKAWCWLLLAVLMLSGSPLLCTSAAAAANKTYYSGENGDGIVCSVSRAQISACWAVLVRQQLRMCPRYQPSG